MHAMIRTYVVRSPVLQYNTIQIVGNFQVPQVWDWTIRM